jgi:hypothetical protein
VLEQPSCCSRANVISLKPALQRPISSLQFHSSTHALPPQSLCHAPALQLKAPVASTADAKYKAKKSLLPGKTFGAGRR